MGWDVVLFSSRQQITDLQAVDESLLTPIDFDALMQQHFASRVQHGEHIAIQGPDFSISYYTGPPVSNKIFTLRGENALYALVRIAATHGLQLYDVALDAFIDLDHPEKNGYENFQQYLRHVLGNGA